VLQLFAHQPANSQVAVVIARHFVAAFPLGRQSVLIPHEEIVMRLIPILAAATIGLFATAAVAQTRDPGSAPPGVSQDGPGKPAPVKPADVKKMDTTPPSSTPAAAEKTTKKSSKKQSKKQSM
jgi:hypothetical protein